jgi:GNAT superfamily N-acetyltransferase
MSQQAMFEEAERANYEFQTGMYFTAIARLTHCVGAYSDVIENEYWNYAGLVSAEERDVPELVREVTDFFEAKNRPTTIYVSPSSRYEGLEEALVERRFERSFQDTWMFLSGSVSSEVSKPAGVEIRALTPPDHDLFVELFELAYGGIPTPENPYGGLPPSYPEALRQSLGRTWTNKAVRHYIADIQDRPAGLATLIYAGELGCIYNVGTVPELRGKGVGTALSVRAVEEALEAGVKTVFLQTEADSDVEKWYEWLGFRRGFLASGMVAGEGSST